MRDNRRDVSTHLTVGKMVEGLTVSTTPAESDRGDLVAATHNRLAYECRQFSETAYVDGSALTALTKSSTSGLETVKVGGHQHLILVSIVRCTGKVEEKQLSHRKEVDSPASRCFANQGPSATPAFAAEAALSRTEACCFSDSLGAMYCAVV